MSPGTNVVAMIGPADPIWPSLTGILHWHRQSGPLLRLCIIHPADPRFPNGGAAAVLERIARFLCPGLRTERRELDDAPGSLPERLTSWLKESPDASWILQLASDLPGFAWSLDGIASLPFQRIVRRQPDGSWSDVRPPAATLSVDAPPPATAPPEFRREDFEELPIAELIRAQTGESPIGQPVVAIPIQPLPTSALVQAAIGSAWNWKAAFLATQSDPGTDGEDVLFQRFLAALLQEFGLRNLVHGNRRSRSNSTGTSPSSRLWVLLGTRLIVLDARLCSAQETNAPQPEAGDSGLSALAADIVNAVRERSELASLQPEWVLLRPCHSATGLEKLLAENHGIRVIDESECRHLPARLAALFLLPLPASAVDIERRLATHFAGSGSSRAFGPEPTLLQQQRATASDPVVVLSDALLEQIQRTRGQNWLLWTHQERTHLRVPAEGRASAATDWKAMLAAFVGLDMTLVSSRQTPRVVLIDFPDVPEHRKRVADWLRPFLNASLTFDTARARFAAEARVTAEAENAQRASGRAATTPPAPSTSSNPAPARPAPKPQATAARPAPARATPTPNPRRMQKVSLEDLDRALDSAFTPPSPSGTSASSGN